MATNPIKSSDFDAIRLRLASPEVMRDWSYGEVSRPETINYRTQRPEKDGLFCERIFGPSKDWECYCGKYKKIRYKGIVCDKCGVEVTRSLVRRERMGHIELKAAVTHIWFLRTVPTKIGMVLDLSTQNLEKVVYFANFIVTKIDEELKKATLDQIKQEFKAKKKQIENEINQQIQVTKSRQPQNDQETKEGVDNVDQDVMNLNQLKDQRTKELEEAFGQAEKELKELKEMKIISESTYQDLSLKYGHVFEASIGAEAIRELLERVDLDALITELDAEIADSAGLKKEKLIRRVKLLKSLKRNKIRPEWMVLKVIPIIPPDLRPMVPLDGGRFATSDLNDLYRRVINRNNRLRQLTELNAPEVITRNEKRMLQEAVDALIDNSARHGKTVTASTGQKRMLKSIADMLKGKQGRFRQNLLGKRTDYSGRSVIVIGPELRLDQCGLPKIMAIELFKPFIISRLIKDEYVHNVRSANRFIESGRPEVWDILEEIIKKSYVLLNRAPTLHRLGIQAFRPVLIEGKAIRIHPMVCTGFNADFDGDQMAVHVPLTKEAVKEAKEIMLATNNLLKPATGDPEVKPNQDIVWGAYYMTQIDEQEGDEDEQKLKHFSSEEEAMTAYHYDYIKLQQPIMVRVRKEKNKKVKTSIGRLLFNRVVPDELSFVNQQMDKKALGELIKLSLELCEKERAVNFLDNLKHTSFKYLTKSGLSWGMNDLPEVSANKEIIGIAENKIDEIDEQYAEGLLTQGERHSKVIEIWNRTKEEIEKESIKALGDRGSVYSMIKSGARGTIAQVVQIIGMKGPVANPSGEIIELPIKGNFKEGIAVLEYFISTHGTRKGLSDTALRTANAGYLTRRLIDVAQDAVILEEDCKDTEGTIITKAESDEMGANVAKRVVGRYVIEKVVDPKSKKTLIEANTLVTEEVVRKIESLEIEEIKVRSLLSCKAGRGVCQKCYGYDLGYNKPVEMGTAVGIIAAQSIGEPGTQLTMRTFHTGGVAGVSDITQGLPRVEEIFETRPPKHKAFITDVAGMISIEEGQKTIQDEKGNLILKGVAGQKIIKVHYEDIEEDTYKLPRDLRGNLKSKKAKSKLKVKDGDKIKRNGIIIVLETGQEVKVKRGGLVKIEDEKIIKIVVNAAKAKEYVIPRGFVVWVKDGQMVEKGDQLTEGSLDLKQLYRLKGQEATQKYILKEIQYIYSSQGQKLNDKHIELITRQMFSRVYIKDAGDTSLLPGDIIERAVFEEENKRIVKNKQGPATGEVLLQGISKTALSTDSFLSAASFQETQKVLTNAAVTGKIDYLRGLKENVIIGRLIPAGTGFEAYKKGSVYARAEVAKSVEKASETKEETAEKEK